MGAPVIISDIGAAPEIVRAPPDVPAHRTTGWRVPPANPEALAVNGNYLFVANIGGGMSSCLIDGITGELSNCQSATTPQNAAQIYAPDGISIGSNGGTTYAYIASSGGANPAHQGVSRCTVNGGALQSCSFGTGDGSYSLPSDLVLWNNYIYVTNFYNGDTPYCDSSITSCLSLATPPSNLFDKPEGLFITTLASNTYAYFTNHGNNTVTLCTVSSINSFTNCTITDGYFTGFGNLTILNNIVNPKKAYIPSGLKSISICDVSMTDGTLSQCVNSTEVGFNNPSGLVID